MKLAILTTQTIHHTYFINELNKYSKIDLVIVEKPKNVYKNNLNHPFEKIRDEFEKKHCLGDLDIKINSIANTLNVEDINENLSISELKKINPDIIIVFGTRKLEKNFVTIFNEALWNLHGGNPEEYRGLDSHLWAIFEKRFDEIKTCIHKVEFTLDTGKIFKIYPLEIYNNCKLHELRYLNTKICLKLSKELIHEYSVKGIISSVQQKKRGNYYSHMTECQKDKCVKLFNDYTKYL